MSLIAALASFGATTAGLMGIGTGVVAGTTGTAAITAAGASAAALGTGTSAAIGATTAGALGAGAGAIQAAATGQDIGKGALMGAGTGLVSAGVGSGLAAGAKAAGMAGTIGNAATNVAVGGTTGAVVGAGKSAITGGDVGKGALLGGATGAVAAGALSGMDAIGTPTSQIGSPTTANVTPTAGNPLGIGPSTAGLSGTGEVVGGNIGLNNINQTLTPSAGSAGSLTGGAPSPTVGTSPVSPSTDTGALNSLQGIKASASPTVEPSAPNMAQIEKGLTAAGLTGGTEYAGKSLIDAQDAAAKAAAEDKARGLAAISQGNSGLAGVRAAGLPDGTGPLGGLGSIGRATGGITALAHGGQIPLGDGAYIIPADVVSALGNGSSKAGAEYLRQLMVAVRKEAIGRQGMGAAKKHVS
jgi:trimeric autotransporter adhesin